MTYPDPRDEAGYAPPTYLGETGEAKAWIRPASRAADLDTGGGGGAHYLARGTQTAGRFGLYRWDMGPEPSGPGPHFHRTMSESFFVLGGAVQLYDGRGWVDTGPGDFCHVPEGGIHGFRNESGAPASMLILFSPGAPREGYFEGVVEMFQSGRTVSADEFREFCERHDNFYI